jgi:hypothetical protein
MDEVSDGGSLSTVIDSWVGAEDSEDSFCSEAVALEVIESKFSVFAAAAEGAESRCDDDAAAAEVCADLSAAAAKGIWDSPPIGGCVITVAETKIPGKIHVGCWKKLTSRLAAPCFLSS